MKHEICRQCPWGVLALQRSNKKLCLKTSILTLQVFKIRSFIKLYGYEKKIQSDFDFNKQLKYIIFNLLGT